VVDASVFPRIPGFFLVSAVYMIAEKAAEAILAKVPAARTRNSLSETHELTKGESDGIRCYSIVGDVSGTAR
jgi:hypothetical protein